MARKRRRPRSIAWCDCGHYGHREPDGRCPQCNQPTTQFDLVPRGGASVVRCAKAWATDCHVSYSLLTHALQHAVERMSR